MSFEVPPTAPENKISPLAESLRPIETPNIGVSPKAESLRETAPVTEPGHEPSMVIESAPSKEPASPPEIGIAPTARSEEPAIKETMKSAQSETTGRITPPLNIGVTELTVEQAKEKAKMTESAPAAVSAEEAPTDRDPEIASLPPDKSPTMPSRILKI